MQLLGQLPIFEVLRHWILCGFRIRSKPTPHMHACPWHALGNVYLGGLSILGWWFRLGMLHGSQACHLGSTGALETASMAGVLSPRRFGNRFVAQAPVLGGMAKMKRA